MVQTGVSLYKIRSPGPMDLPWTLSMTVSTGLMLGRTTLHLSAWMEPTDTQVNIFTHKSLFLVFLLTCSVCLRVCPHVVLTEDIPHIFAMTLFEEYIYWTDWETKSINRAHKTLGTNKSMLISTLHRPMDIHVYHPYRQPEGISKTPITHMS